MFNDKLIASRGGKSIDFYSDPTIKLLEFTDAGMHSNIVINEYSMADGGEFSGSRLPTRTLNITATFDFNSDEPHIAAKHRLYDLFLPDQLIHLRYVTELYDVYTEGYCEECTIPPNMYPMKASIVLKCPNPYFKKNGKITTLLYGTSGGFAFKKNNTRFNEVRFKSPKTDKITNIDLNEHITTGVNFKIKFKADASFVIIENKTNGTLMRLDYNFQNGDVLDICTITGIKSITLRRNGIDTNLLHALSVHSSWVTIVPGNNKLRVDCDISPSLCVFEMCSDVIMSGV